MEFWDVQTIQILLSRRGVSAKREEKKGLRELENGICKNLSSQITFVNEHWSHWI